MGNKLSYIDHGLFLGGVAALEDVDTLHQLGIKFILNVADEELYRQRGHDLRERLEPFTRKVVGLLDQESEDIGSHFEEMAEFIQRGRAGGGVVVHCAGGISRAATACLAYLMLWEGLSLHAAFHKVHRARLQISPNPGFWRQLRELERRLRDEGRELRELRAGELPPFEEPEGKQLWEVVGGVDTGGVLVRGGSELSSEKLALRLATGSVVLEKELLGNRLRYRLLAGFGPYSGWVSAELEDKVLARRVPFDPALANGTIRQLDVLSVSRSGFDGLYLTARVVLAEEAGTPPAEAAECLRSARLPGGLAWASVAVGEGEPVLAIRALVPASHGRAGPAAVRGAIIAALGPSLVVSVDVEGVMDAAAAGKPTMST